ncbi:hypothetical protein Airi01_070130 [Actinoallomurus iriomotensis]|uniref:Uncharacterized protein n=2 Tax=Thermomonosporaceae TaxID=2012 RepID=A0A9W6RM57_9ACTN|nr:hypothetical protein Airi01_070130 [Actinoallomurus iriomotensis]
MMSEEREPWPADDPWYRFTPRNLAVGYLSLFAALICLGWSVMSLLDDDTGVRQTIFFAIFGAVAVFWLVRTTNGLRVLLRRRSGR